MSIYLTCRTCQRQIEAAEPPRNGMVPCPTCGTLLVVPDLQTQDDDDTPYRTERHKRCPQCTAKMAEQAVVCIECGYNLETRAQARTDIRVKERNRTWHFGVIPIFFFSVHLRKTRKGRRLVTVTPRLLGIPLNTREVDLRDCREIWTDYRTGFSAVGLTIMLILLLLCIVPGLGWCYYALTKPNYVVRLPDNEGSYMTVYEGGNQSVMQDVLDTIAEMGGLTVVRK